MTISYMTIIHKTFIKCLTQYGLVLFVLFAFLATWHLPKGWVMVRILQSQCNWRVHCEESDYISQLITVQIFAVSWLTRFLSACHHIYAMNHHTERWYYKICQLNKVGVMFCAFLNISTPIIIQSAISSIEVQHAWVISMSFVYLQRLSGRFLMLRSNTNSENGLSGWVVCYEWSCYFQTFSETLVCCPNTYD